MKYLLDTHVAKWALDETEKLSGAARAIIGNTSLHLCVSIASAWEIAVKISIGKLDFHGGTANFLEKLRHFGVEIIGINDAHIKLIETLPFVHRDPFDRILIATAMAENLTIITSDETIRKYEVQCVW